MSAPPATRVTELRPIPVSYEVALAQESDLAGEIAAASAIDIPWLLAALILLGILYALKYIVVPLVKLLYPRGGSLLSRITSWAIGTLLAPVKFIVQAVTNAVATGIDHHAGKLTLWLWSMAYEVHDMSVELGNFATSTAASFHDLRYTTLPREINRVTAPLRSRLTTLETVRKQLDGIARAAGYSSFPVMVKAEQPHIAQLKAADAYVLKQGHVSLAGALSVYEATSKSWTATEAEVRKLGFYTVPDFIEWAKKEILVTLPAKVEAEATERKKLATAVQPLITNKAGLLALLTIPGFTRAFDRIRTAECTPIAECAVNQNFGSGAWSKLLNFLKDILEAAIAALVFADLCNILGVVSEGIDVFMPVLEELVTLESGICAFGGASIAAAMPPPAYVSG